MSLVTARAPCRVDLAGGTLDIWPLGLLHEGAVTVNVAIEVMVTVTIRSRESGFELRQDGGRFPVETSDEWLEHNETALFGHLVRQTELASARVDVTSQSPRGGGLGASSSLAIAFLAAAEEAAGGHVRGPDARSAIARDVEARLMSLPTGRQDHFPPLYGGALAIHHEIGGERVERLAVDLEALGACLTVAYTGKSHFSAGKNWSVVRGRLSAEPEIVRRFEGLARVASDLAQALRESDLPAVGELMGREWELRRGLAEGIATPGIETMLEAARRAGAWGGKACGAGGGGCVAVLSPGAATPAVRDALAELGTVLEARPTAQPVTVETDRQPESRTAGASV